MKKSLFSCWLKDFMGYLGYYVYIKTDDKHELFDIGVGYDILKGLIDHRDERRRLLALPIDRRTLFWKLVYYEHGHSLTTATTRCQKLLKLPPSKRNSLIERHNPGWRDLSIDWQW